MYKLINNRFNVADCVERLSDNAFIPFDEANIDYQTFKKEINDQTAQLEDADGNLMTAQQAIDYVATLP